MALIWIVAGVFLLIGSLAITGLIIKARGHRQRYQQVGGAQLSEVADLDNGIGKIKGWIVARDELLRSPMSNQRCVYYHFVVEEQRTRTSGGKHGGTQHYWATLISDTQAVPVTVEDDTGAATVTLRDAEVVLKSTERSTSGMFKSPPPRLKRVIEEHYGQRTKGLLFNKTLRYSEAVLEDGAKVVVVGKVKMRGQKPAFINGEEPVIVSDKSAKELAGHYRRSMIACGIGAGVVGLLMVGVIVGAIMMSSLVGRGPQPQAAGPQPPNDNRPDVPIVNPVPQPDQKELKEQEKKAVVPKLKALPAIAGARDMIRMIDVKQDVVHGSWQIKGGALECKSQGLVPRVQIPYLPPAEYDLVVTFSQPRLRNGISLVMPTPQGGSFFWAIGDGRSCTLYAQPEKRGQAVVEPNTLYTTTVRVRRDRVQALLGDQLLIDHATDFGDLKMDTWRKLRDERVLGVACDDPTVFHRIEVVEISGPGKAAR